MSLRRSTRLLPAVLVAALLALAALAPRPGASGPAPPPQLQAPCDSFASAVTGDSILRFVDDLGPLQALPAGMSVAACSLRTTTEYYVTSARVELRAWDPTTLAPDPSTIALRSVFFDPSRILWAGSQVPRATFVPPVVTRSVAGVAEPPPSQVAMQVSNRGSQFGSGPMRALFDPDGPASLPAAVKFARDGERVPLPGPHPVLAHAVCAGDEDLASLRVVQSVMRTDVSPFPAPREFLQRFRVPEQVELRWVELAFGELFVPYFETAGEQAPKFQISVRPTVLAIVDGHDLPQPIPNMPSSMVEALFDIGSLGFGAQNQHWISHLDFDRTVTLEPDHDYWIYVREAAPITFLNRRIKGNETSVFRAGVGPYFARADSAGAWIQAADQVLAFRILGRPTAPPGPAPSAAAAFAMRATPNPAPGSVRVDWSGAVGPVHFEVLDVRGRRVDEAEGGAAGSWVWVGTDRGGRPVASGIYFVHTRDSAGGHVVRRVVIVR